VRPGDVLAGKYRIEQVLGQGGMGVVVAATHLQLEERVAIKFLLPDALTNVETVARFAREARAAVKIKSEHVARVTDVGTLDTGCPYMVMEYLHGMDLGALVESRGALPVEEAVDFVLQAAEAIAEAHSLGIIHRDLKPANLFFTQRADGSACIKVLDFGISKVTGLGGSGSDLGMTRTTTVMGSPLYMSPEQMTSSRDVDVRTDIWALGVILYELVSGRVPFVADTMPQLCAMVLQQPAPPLRNVRPDAPEPLQTAINRCLEKEPARRFAHMAEFAAALLPFATRAGRTSVERISRVINATGLPSDQLRRAHGVDSVRAGGATHAAWGNTLPMKRRVPWLVLGVSSLAIAGVAIAVLASRSNGDDAASKTTLEHSTAAAAGVSSAPPLTSAKPEEPPVPVVRAVEPAVAPASPKPSAVVLGPRDPAKAAVKLSKPPVAVRAPVAPSSPAPAPVKRNPADLYSDRK
jgi:serine/threonine-protein kinase